METWTDNLSPSKSRSYGYDELDRLETATAAGMWGDLSFTYDELGNRETRTLNGETTGYTYGEPTNRLSTLSGAETGAFTYDGAGRLETEVRRAPGEIFSDGFESGDTGAWEEGGSTAAATLIYTFNSADQLSRIERGGQTLGDYIYDGDGFRVSKTVEGQTVYYLRDPSGNTLAEYDKNSTLLAEYVYAGGRQVAKVEPDGGGREITSFFHADHLGTALVITNDAGAVSWFGDYYPFGGEFSSVGTPDRYRFTQHELDPSSALIYAKARYFNPRIGRFLSVDPVGGNPASSQSWNRYAYVLNNPVKLVDPTGGSPVASGQSIQVMKQSRADIYWALLDVPYAGVILAATFDTLVNAFPTDQELVMDLIPGPAMVSSPSKKVAKAVREGIYEFTDTTGKPYVGQSVDVPNRLKRHVRSGKVDPNTSVKTTEVTGGKTAREVAEHKRIQEVTGGEPARFSDKVSNKRDPVGPRRQHLLKED